MNLTDEDVLSHHKAGHVCGDDVDIVNGKPTGSIRVSFGYYSNKGSIKIICPLLLIIVTQIRQPMVPWAMAFRVSDWNP